jgi:DNA-binding response OmpR family regulator
MIPKRILIIDDEENFRHMLSVILRKERFDAFERQDMEVW